VLFKLPLDAVSVLVAALIHIEAGVKPGRTE
jgi:hypothetical protein